MKEQTISYLGLFCAMLLARKHKATFAEAVTLVPLAGNASLLAAKLLEQQAFVL